MQRDRARRTRSTRLEVADPERVAYLTQTTLAVDETAGVVDALRERFPAIAGPRSDDICYATQNRQDAVSALAGDCDLVLVVGSANSSNSHRLVEVAERAGCPAHAGRGRRPDSTRRGWPAPAASASPPGRPAPERIVQGLVSRARRARDRSTVGEHTVANEDGPASRFRARSDGREVRS